MRHNPGLKVADVVRGVVHELRVPDAAVVRLLEPFQLHLKEVEPFDVHHDGRLPSAVRCLYISSSEGASEPMLRHHLVHPSQTLKMVPIKFARLGRARGGQNALRIPAQDRPVGHVRQAGDRKRPRAHGVCQLVVRWRFRCDPCHAPMRVDIDGNRLTQDFERGRRGFGGLGSGCRTSRPNSAGEHRAASYSTPTVAARKCVPDHSNPCCSPRECAGQHRLARQTVIEPKPPSASRGGRRRNYTMLVAWPNRRVGSAT